MGPIATSSMPVTSSPGQLLLYIGLQLLMVFKQLSKISIQLSSHGDPPPHLLDDLCHQLLLLLLCGLVRAQLFPQQHCLLYTQAGPTYQTHTMACTCRMQLMC